MKNIFRIIIPVLAVLLPASCTDDATGPLYNGSSSGFAFVSTVANAEISGEDNNQILIPVNRGSLQTDNAKISFEYDVSDDPAQPDWRSSDPNRVFSLLTTNLIFQDGSYTANAIIRFSDINKLGLTDKYRLRLTMTDGLSDSKRGTVTITVSRKLTFEYYGEADFMDECLFFNPYTVKVYKAVETEAYRVMDPYSQGLAAEEYAEMGWMGKTPAYIQFLVDAEGNITYEPFQTGMLVEGKYMAFAYYPGEYQWGKDFSQYNSKNVKVSDKVFNLYPVYCLPSFRYGYLNDGAYPLTITMH